MFILLVSILGLIQWDTSFELKPEGYIRDVFTDEEGCFHVVAVDNGTMFETMFDAEGSEISRIELPEPEESPFLYTLTLRRKEEGYGSTAVLNCTGSQGIEFSTDLSDVYYVAELPAMKLPASDGGCYVTYTPAQAEEYWKLFRISPSGEILYETVFELSGGPVISINDMVELPDGGVVLTGVTDECGMNLFMMVLAFDNGGNCLFRRREALRFHGSGELVEVTAEGNILICGITGDERDDGFFMPPADTDVFLDCCTVDGTLLWRASPQLPFSNHPIAMHVSQDGSIVIIASSQREDGLGERRYFLVAGRNE